MAWEGPVTTPWLPRRAFLPGSAIEICRFGSENHSTCMRPLNTRLDDNLRVRPEFDRHSLALITASLRVTRIHLIIASCSGADMTYTLVHPHGWTRPLSTCANNQAHYNTPGHVHGIFACLDVHRTILSRNKHKNSPAAV